MKDSMNRLFEIAFLAIFLCASNVMAEETLIFYEGDPPLSHPAGQAPSGVYFDLVTAIFDDLGVSYTVHSLPFKRALMQAKEGKGIVAGIFKTEERAQYLDFSENFYSTQVVLFTVRHRSFPYAQMDDLRNKKIGAKLGWSYGQAFDTARSEGLFAVVEGESTSLINQLLQGRTDAFIDNKLTGIYTFKELGIIDQMEILPTPIDTGPHYLGAQKGAKQTLLAQFNERLAAFKKNGRYQSILAPYSQ